MELSWPLSNCLGSLTLEKRRKGSKYLRRASREEERKKERKKQRKYLCNCTHSGIEVVELDRQHRVGERVVHARLLGGGKGEKRE